MEKLRDLKLKTAFTLQLKNKFQVLADAEDQTQEGSGDINAKWQQLRIPYEQTCKACLETKQRKRTDKRSHINDLASQAKDAESKGEG